MARALSVNETMSIKTKLLDFEGAWADAFGTPENKGVWFVWGRSGHGKTSFVMQLCKELCRHYKGVYNSLEEGVGYTMQQTLRKNNMMSVNSRLAILDREPIEDLSTRMSKRMSPHFYVVDSIQYARLTKKRYFDFVNAHKDKLIIFISQAEGKLPKGNIADLALFDAVQKIWVEGFRAISNGRSNGSVGHYDIWPERAREFHGDSIRID